MPKYLLPLIISGLIILLGGAGFLAYQQKDVDPLIINPISTSLSAKDTNDPELIRSQHQAAHQVYISYYQILKDLELDDDQEYLPPLISSQDINEVREEWKKIDQKNDDQLSSLSESLVLLNRACGENEKCKTTSLPLMMVQLKENIDDRKLNAWHKLNRFGYLTRNNETYLTPQQKNQLLEILAQEAVVLNQRLQTQKNLCPKIKENFHLSYQYKALCEESPNKKVAPPLVSLKARGNNAPLPDSPACKEYMTLFSKSECEELKEIEQLELQKIMKPSN